MKTILGAFLWIAAFSNAHAQTGETISPSEASHVLTMQLDNGELNGEAADLILERLENAQFVMIGEDHGFADPSEIALALAKAGRRHGLTHHVAEIGPITDQIVTDRLQVGGPEELKDLLDGRPFAIPFLSMKADAELANYFVDHAEAREDVLWGVDQEFVGSTLIHFEKLLDLAQHPDAVELASALLGKEQSVFESGNVANAFMNAAEIEDFEALKSAFAGIPEALATVGALEESASIYQAFAEGRGFASNTDRIRYMRSHFIDAYRSSEQTAPRALFKFGAIHMARGTTFLNTFDLGSLTEGVAAANGLEVLRLAVLPLEGQQTVTLPTPESTFETMEFRSLEVAGFLQLVGIEEESIPVDGYATIELAPIRLQLEQEQLNQLPPPAKFIILGYDYFVTTRGARPSVPLAIE